MAFTLFAATVPSYLQILSAVSRLVDKAESHCFEQTLEPDDLIQARLAADMHTFAYQVKSTAVHSLGAIEAVRRGSFSPDINPPPSTFAALRDRLREARHGIDHTDPLEIESFIGKEVRFIFAGGEIAFHAEDFLLSFSQPNFYFHAATSYDILRMKSVPLAKHEFLGHLRRKL